MADEQTTFNEEEVQSILDSFLKEGATLKDLRGVSEENMEAIYSVAHGLYSNGKYEEAETLFSFLTFYDHLERRWWMGLGATRQMRKNFEGALAAYSYTAMLDVEDPMPHLHAADCLLAEKRYDDASSALAAVVHWAGDREEYKEAAQRAEALRQLLPKEEAGAAEEDAS